METETEIAVNSILSQTNENTISETVNNESEKTNIKRKHDDDNLNGHNSSENNSEFHPPQPKKLNQIRLYKQENKGPYEVIIQDKNKTKLNQFQIGKIIKTHHSEIDYIQRSGRNVSVFCNSFQSANDLILSQHLLNYNVFVPSIRVYSYGVANIEPSITETEIFNESICNCSILEVSRIKRRVNNELKDTYFVKITFESDTLPEYISLNYVRVKIEPYMIPVKQCYRCFAYGHVANSPCRSSRLCRDCGCDFHSEPCELPRKCVHCFGPHSSNSKQCPEYTRQKNIKDRMSFMKEDYFTASKFFPITYKIVKGAPRRPQSFSQATRSLDITNPVDYPALPVLPSKSEITLTNRYSSLNSIIESPTSDNVTPQSSNQYRKPTTNIQNKQKNNTIRSTPRQNLANPNRSNLTPKPSPPEITQADKDRLKSLMDAKLTEIRNKLKVTNMTTKKQLDDFLTTFYSTQSLEKQFTNSQNKSNPTLNKTSVAIPPDKKHHGNS
jgi:hypothetical protein